MEKTSNQEYRDNLAEELNKSRSEGERGRIKAEGKLEMAQGTPEYQAAKEEKEQQRKEKVVALKQELGVENKEKNKDAISEVLEGVKQKFLNKEQFGVEGEKAAMHVENLIQNFEKFKGQFIADYQKEKQQSGMTPDEFLEEKMGYGRSDGHVIRLIDIADYENKMQTFEKELKSYTDAIKMNDKKKSTHRPEARLGLTLDSYEKIPKKKKTSFLGKWEDATVVSDYQLDEKQRAILIAAFGGDEKSRKNAEGILSGREGGYPNIKTDIPGVNLNAHRSFYLKENGKSIHREGRVRTYGWDNRNMKVEFERSFLLELLGKSTKN